MQKLDLKALFLGFVTLSAASAHADHCESSNGMTLRHWVMDNAYACEPGKGLPASSADIEAVGEPFNFESWTLAEEITPTGAKGEWLDVELIAGEWDAGSVFATWELAPGFWERYAVAVMSVRVGDGSDDSLSDFATFIITPGESSGTLMFAQVSNANATAGLAEIKLWTPQT